MTKRDRVGGWVKNGHFRRDVIMQWPLIDNNSVLYGVVKN